MKILILACLISILLTYICIKITLPILKRKKAGQTILHYVEAHKEKNGTPTMGGLFFILPSVLVYFIFSPNRISGVAVAIGLAFMVVGFIDDFIKIKFNQNEGLKAYQKIIFQFAIAIVAGVFCYINGITLCHIPFFKENIDFGIFTIPFVALIFIAITNCVNLTDGLDGLASSVSSVYLIILTILIGLQLKTFEYMYLKTDEYFSLQTLSCALVGGLLGFLIFNSSKAKIFMGDTGSLSLGGFIGSISIFSSNSLFIPIIGIMFVLTGISVIIQVVYFKATKKRVFLMAPLHHHFQLKGKTETQISYSYALITLMVGLCCLFVYI